MILLLVLVVGSWAPRVPATNSPRDGL